MTKWLNDKIINPSVVNPLKNARDANI